jgi:hypothetical protein
MSFLLEQQLICQALAWKGFCLEAVSALDKFHKVLLPVVQCNALHSSMNDSYKLLVVMTAGRTPSQRPAQQQVT